MIRVKLFKNKSAMRRCACIAGDPVVGYDNNTIVDLLYQRNIDAPFHTIPPFHDEESLKLLNAFDIEVPGEHWYSMVARDPYLNEENEGQVRTWMPFTVLGKQLKFALALVYFSREGCYLTYDRHMDIEEKTWKILVQMPFDILLATTGEQIGSCEFPQEYLIENYPYYDTKIEVHVKPHEFIVESFGYKKPPCDEGNLLDVFLHNFIDDCPSTFNKKDDSTWNTGFKKPMCALYRGNDGLYYSDNYKLSRALHYSWENDLEDVAERLLGRSDPREVPRKLVSVNDTYSVSNFQKMLCHVRGGTCPQEEDFCRFSWYDVLCCDKRPYSEFTEKEETFKVVSHLTLLTDPGYFHPVMMVVEEFRDGMYKVYWSEAAKSSTLEEMLAYAIKLRKEDAEITVLFLDTNGYIDDINDLDYAICGARVQWDRIEVYDREDAMQLFGKTLKKVLEERRLYGYFSGC